MGNILLLDRIYKSLIRISLILFFGLKFTYCAGNASVPFEDGELLEQSALRVRLVSENFPRIREGPYCTNFHIEFSQEGKFVNVGVIQTKLYLENIPDRYLRIAFITVIDGYRDQGIGSEALKILISYCNNLKIFNYFEAEVSHWNTGPRTNRVPFYERLGFVKWGYVAGNKEEAMIMVLEL
jgi:ribosomal protein S18 acetylase RimI-like enzyme